MSTPLTVPRIEPTAKSRSVFLKASLLVAVVAGLASALYFGGVGRESWKEALSYVKDLTKPSGSSDPAAIIPSPPKYKANNAPWNELVSLKGEQEGAMGFRYYQVTDQTEPIRLELTGRTAYDDTTIVRIRPRFDARVEQVFAKIGQKIKKGEPLVELYSTDLAKAKTDYQTKYVQWQHDRNLYNLRQKLVTTGAISQQLWVDTQNDEQKSRLDFNIAFDYLKVFYEIPKEEIDPLLERLGDKTTEPGQFGTVTDKAKLILRAKADGYVITRAVVPGNYYESTDVLMEVAPLDHLWVLVNVYELDQDKVSVGQTIQIHFPFLAQKIQGRVDYVAPEVSKDTRAVKIRATIPNPDARLKSDMLVKAMLDIPPIPGQTIIPRNAMVALSGGEYVFVRKAAEKGGKSEGTGNDKDDQFERVKITIAQENTDTVVVAAGLKAGQEVVTNGSLILSQLYEDQRVTINGTPAQ